MEGKQKLFCLHLNISLIQPHFLVDLIQIANSNLRHGAQLKDAIANSLRHHQRLKMVKDTTVNKKCATKAKK